MSPTTEGPRTAEPTGHRRNTRHSNNGIRRSLLAVVVEATHTRADKVPALEDDRRAMAAVGHLQVRRERHRLRHRGRRNSAGSPLVIRADQ